MNDDLLAYLAEPVTGAELELEVYARSGDGRVWEGVLHSPTQSYPIVRGIPRFVDEPLFDSVRAFGDEWNSFDFIDFKKHWLNHMVANTFGSTSAFKGKVIVDAGAGSGSQSRWMTEAGAKRVIALELSHSVDGVMDRNLRELKNVDIIQCSIDRPPIKERSIDLVVCHNVIQHTPSVLATAQALWSITQDEFVFSCYERYTATPARWLRHHLVYMPVRGALRRAPFVVRDSYSRVMATLRLVPLLGFLLEKSGFLMSGDVPERTWRATFRAAHLNTFDWFGAHQYQHLLTESEIRAVIADLGPRALLNDERVFSRPPHVAAGLRLRR